MIGLNHTFHSKRRRIAPATKGRSIAISLASAPVAIVCLQIFTAQARAQSFTFQTVDAPGETTYTELIGINDAGQVTGYNNTATFFEYQNGVFTTLPLNAGGINNAGQIAGTIYGAGGVQAAVYSNGKITTLNIAGCQDILGASGINNIGQVVGTCNGPNLGFQYDLRSGSTTLLNSGFYSTWVSGINDLNQITGCGAYAYCNEAFFLSGGNYILLDDDATVANGLNNAGLVVGLTANYTGFIYDSHSGSYSNILVPSSTSTDINGINNAGQIVGEYSDSTGNYHGFIGTPTLSVMSPFLLRQLTGGSLLDLDLPTLIPKLQTWAGVLASGLAADGVSSGIVLFQVPTEAPVTFTTNNGTTLLPYNSHFMKNAPTQGNSTLTVTPIQIGSLLYAIALLQAPPANVAPDFSAPAVVTAQQQGAQMQQAYLPLVPPPVLLVHGLWGDANSLSNIGEYLNNQPPWNTNSSLVYAIAYPSDLAFDSKPTTKDFNSWVTSSLSNLQSQGVVAGRVDLVAHSMGGLVARH